MLFSTQNIIDKKIVQIFPAETLKVLETDKLDYFGINISSDSKADFVFKIYFKNNYSDELYSKSEKNPFIEYLSKNKLMNFLTFVYDKENKDCTRYEIGLSRRNNEQMSLLFSYLKENCSFYEKYEKQILELSKMKVIDSEDSDYNAFYFVALLNNNKTLKCHWLNRVYPNPTEYYNNEYYLDYIENSSIEEFKKILPTVRKAIQNCSGDMLMEGIDYTEFGLQKYKIYVKVSKNPYDGLIDAYSGNLEIERKLKIIKEWNNLHQEIYCGGFAIGKDIDNNSIVNLYFRIKNSPRKRIKVI